MGSTLPHRPVIEKNLILVGTRFAVLLTSRVNTGGLKPEVVMANETELFYLVLIIVLTMVMHVILARKGPRSNNKAK